MKNEINSDVFREWLQEYIIKKKEAWAIDVYLYLLRKRKANFSNLKKNICKNNVDRKKIPANELTDSLKCLISIGLVKKENKSYMALSVSEANLLLNIKREIDNSESLFETIGSNILLFGINNALTKNIINSLLKIEKSLNKVMVDIEKEQYLYFDKLFNYFVKEESSLDVRILLNKLKKDIFNALISSNESISDKSYLYFVDFLSYIFKENTESFNDFLEFSKKNQRAFMYAIKRIREEKMISKAIFLYNKNNYCEEENYKKSHNKTFHYLMKEYPDFLIRNFDCHNKQMIACVKKWKSYRKV